MIKPPGRDRKGLSGWFLSGDKIATSVGLVFSVMVIQRLFGFTRGVIFARVLGPEQLGIYTLALFLVPLLTTIATLGVESAFGRYASRYQMGGGLRWFVRRTFLLTLVISILMSVMLLAKPSFFSRLLYGKPLGGNIILVVAACIPGSLLLRNLAAMFRGLKFFRAGAFQEFAQIAIYAAVGIPLIFIIRSALAGILGYMIATYASVGMFLLLFLRYLRRLEPIPRAGDEQGFYRRLLKFSLWFVVTPLLGQVFRFMDRFWLQHLRGAFDQGVYSATANLSETVSAFGLAINSVIYPHISATWESGQHERAISNLDLALRVTGVIVLLVGMLLVVFGKWFIILLLGSQYAPGAQVLPFLVVHYIFTVLVWLYGIYPTLIERTHISTIGVAVALPTNYRLNQILIPHFGMLGAALATMLSHVLLWAVIAAICRGFGLRISKRTVMVCLLAFVLLLPSGLTWFLTGPAGLGAHRSLVAGFSDVALVLVVGMVLFVCTRRTWILSEPERRAVYGELGRVVGRAKGILLRRR